MSELWKNKTIIKKNRTIKNRQRFEHVARLKKTRKKEEEENNIETETTMWLRIDWNQTKWKIKHEQQQQKIQKKKLLKFNSDKQTAIKSKRSQSDIKLKWEGKKMNNPNDDVRDRVEVEVETF